MLDIITRDIIKYQEYENNNSSKTRSYYCKMHVSIPNKLNIPMPWKRIDGNIVLDHASFHQYLTCFLEEKNGEFILYLDISQLENKVVIEFVVILTETTEVYPMFVENKLVESFEYQEITLACQKLDNSLGKMRLVSSYSLVNGANVNIKQLQTNENNLRLLLEFYVLNKNDESDPANICGYLLDNNQKILQPNIKIGDTIEKMDNNCFVYMLDFGDNIKEHVVYNFEILLDYDTDTVSKHILYIEMCNKNQNLLGSLAIQISKDQSITKVPQRTIGSIIGYPNSGKINLINEFRELINLDRIGLNNHLVKSEFRKLEIQKINNYYPLDFVILDTSGYVFGADSKRDGQLLKQLVTGLRVDTDFSLTNASCVDVDNSVNEFVILYCACDLLERIRELEELYKNCVTALIKKYGDEYKSKSHVRILILQVDMLTSMERETLKDNIMLLNIPENFVYYCNDQDKQQRINFFKQFILLE